MRKAVQRAWRLVITGCGLCLGMIIAAPCGAADPPRSAVHIVPEDCGFFSNTLRCREQFDRVAHSKAVKRILELPPVKQAIAQAKANPQYEMALQFLATPPFKEIVELAIDASTDEIFLFGDARWGELLGAYLAIWQEMMWAQLAAGGRQQDPTPILIRAVLEHKEHLKLPVLMIGFKISRWEQTDKLLDLLDKQLETAVAQAPPPVAQIFKDCLTIQRGKFGQTQARTYAFNAAKLPIPDGPFLAQIRAKAPEVSEEQAKDLLAFIKNQKMALCIGRHGDYLTLSFGPDTSHLAALGKEPLSDAEIFQHAKKHMDASLLGIGYVSKDLMEAGQFDADELKEMAEKTLSKLQDKLPPGLAERLKKDVKDFCELLEEAIPEPSAALTVSRGNRGIESFTYTQTATPSVDYSKPLSILQRAGADPFLAIATRSKSTAKEYDVAVDWIKRAYGYWTDFGKPMLPPAMVEQAKPIESALLPFFAKVNVITRDKLIPATDATQGLFLLDAKGKFEGIPIVMTLPKVMPMLEIGMYCELNDGKKFEEAMSEYLNAADELIARLSQAIPGVPPGFKIPRPTVTPYGADGSMYFYPLAGILDRNTLPHAVVMAKLLGLSTSPEMSKRAMLNSSLAIKDAVVPLDRPSGVIVVCRPAEFLAGLKTWYKFADEMPNGPFRHMKEPEAVMARMVINAGFDVLGVFKGCTSRSYAEDGYYVNHSWVHVEDLP